MAEAARHDSAPARAPSVVSRAIRSVGRNRHRAMPRLRALQLAARLLPTNMFGRARAALLRLDGARLGPATRIYGALDLHGLNLHGRNLVTGRNVWISPRCSFDLSATITLGDDVSLGHDVVIITADHEIGPTRRRCGPLAPRPVRIGAGAWIGARTTILPGVVIGAGSVVAGGSSVYRDVAPNTMVAGSPARVIRHLDGSPSGAAPTDGG